VLVIKFTRDYLSMLDGCKVTDSVNQLCRLLTWSRVDMGTPVLVGISAA
jgi:hypothetical protein